MKRIILISVMLLALAGCSGPKQEDSSEASLIRVDPSPVKLNEPLESGVQAPSAQEGGDGVAAPEGVAAGGAAIERKFIKTGRIKFETDDADATRETIIASVKANNAYVSRDEEDHSRSSVSHIIVVHVPAARFETFLASATKGVTNFLEKSISNEDVTAQFVDTESRLKTKKEIENRYRALLTKANTVKDILEIERELGEIRTDIEATEAQFRQLNGNITYSTLHINFFKATETSNSFLTELASAFSEGVTNLRAFAVALVVVWPFTLLAICLVAVIGWWRRRRKNAVKRETAAVSSE